MSGSWGLAMAVGSAYLALICAVSLRGRRAVPPASTPKDLPELNAVEVGYLYGGAPRALQVALVGLARSGAVDVDASGRTLTVTGLRPASLSEFEAAVLARVGAGDEVNELLTDDQTFEYVESLRHRLREENLLPPQLPGRAIWTSDRALPLLWFAGWLATPLVPKVWVAGTAQLGLGAVLFTSPFRRILHGSPTLPPLRLDSAICPDPAMRVAMFGPAALSETFRDLSLLLQRNDRAGWFGLVGV